MPYAINRLKVRNFKCFDNKKFYEFIFYQGQNPTILSGPNGFGKTTFFDAVELIFTKKITRLQTSIEDGRINLGKNILLNEANKDGNLILTLTDENNNNLTIVAVIDHQNQKLSIGDSIKYGVTDDLLDSDDEIDTFLNNSNKWKTSLQKCEKLRYSMEHFNVYYYVSQAESVHFLKNSVSNRKDSMNVLLNTINIDKNIEYITKKLIGGSKSKKDVLVNDAITESTESINKKVKELKSKIQKIDSVTEKVEYTQLLDYNIDADPLSWDVENPNFESRELSVNLHYAISEIQALHNFAINKADYDTYLENEKINRIIDSKAIIIDFVNYHQYIENGLINRTKVTHLISEWNKTIDIYNHSSFFRNSLDVTFYKEEDLVKLKTIDDSLISSDIGEVTEIVGSINNAKKTLSNRENMLNSLDKARLKLYQIKKEIDKVSPNCPFCNHKYENVEDLDQAFLNLSNGLSGEKNTEYQKLKSLINSLHNKLENDLTVILSIVQSFDEEKIRELNTLLSNSNQFIQNEERVKFVEKVSFFLNNTDSWVHLGNSEKSLEIRRILQKNLKTYVNSDFINVMDKFEFNNISQKYRDIFSISQTRIINKEYVDNKIKYLKYLYSLSQSSEINVLKEEIKREILKKHQLEVVRENFEKLQDLYQNSTNEYKNQILKKLRVPLLIYSGKILQDYQNGLGVFVSKDEMRFVSNGDAKHDILNTFSSGQLSGFVLAFLFAMNKQYIMKSTDDIGFILVDDPVQTMDDINISSLIEVLRNDFSNKQIILSTHETDKENYILYKFLKYNLRGQSFNVKEKLYL
ncbi:AAA family ATPase [Pseudobacteroides cellulosolvens]|uniref:Rad50/SbcC-type AAA domain-containing protein n=1 Tax=Pseudobacteroides cellulosolvens ATCC 35603 = DSM 2933 TaxID=398512 RepID=A0A0L6JYC1_9FIRM|nr:AAA family ATPase [Pseudobacteroides cellulosolvens]KNY30535.1 hypothetical protein Bccel_5815 [Pseudobacteroides cellulosolvens ATCC 35603 = DSM 2933]